MRLSDAIALYLEHRGPEVSPLTIRNQRQTLAKLSAMYGDHELPDVTTAMLRNWRNTLSVSPASANKYMDRVNAFFTYARRAGWMSLSPTDNVTALHDPPRRQLRLTIDQVAALLDQPNNKRDRAALAVAMEWLLRGSEIADLRVGNIRLHDGMADVRIMKKEGVFAWDEMVITEPLSLELGNWLHAYRANAGRPLSPDDYLFPRQTYRINGAGRQYQLHPDQPMRHPYLIVSRALTAIGVDTGRRGFHTIRRSMARIRYDALLDSKGTDEALGVVQSLLHHSTRKMTEHYLGVDGDRARRNKIMKSEAWVTALPRATSDKPAGQRLATVTRIHP